ncbi:MAG TPA: MFS transporter [Acidobacteriaceae bacterium]|nr:MFS transporter [Acidobacteriaceae bacterium]
MNGLGEGTDVKTRVPPAWLAGMVIFPFGLVVGFTITALPFLLTRQGIPLDRVAETSAIVMSPTFWGWTLCPVLDTGLTRRAYCWLTATVAAVCLALALGVFSPGRLALTTALLLMGELAIVMYGNAANGWLAEFLPDHMRGSVSGWTNVANLGGGALGSLAVMSLASYFKLQWLGVGLAAVIVLGVLVTLAFPEPRRSSFTFIQVFTDARRTTWKACTTRECLTGFALFLAPVGAAAGINLFSGLGQDFRTSPHVVVLVTGAGCAVASAIGALAGGYAADRVNRGYLYLSADAGIVAVSLALALTGHTEAAFIAGALIYNAFTGVVYAAFNALGFQLVGNKSAVASTQLALFTAAINAAVVYMTWADGQGYKHFGVQGLFLVDALASAVALLPLLLLVKKGLPKVSEDAPAEAALRV